MSNDIHIISFNPWKHHLKWVLGEISRIRNECGDSGFSQALPEIKKIGNNILDLYTGNLTTEAIISEICEQLIQQDHLNRSDFKNWIGIPEYKTLELSDESIWVLRYGKEEAQYIHLHPGRYSPNSRRIKGSSWKTALVMKLLYPASTLSLESINNIRRLYLELSPLKLNKTYLSLNEALSIL